MVNENKSDMRQLIESARGYSLRQKINLYGGLVATPLIVAEGVYFLGGIPTEPIEVMTKTLTAITIAGITLPGSFAVGVLGSACSLYHLRTNEIERERKSKLEKQYQD